MSKTLGSLTVGAKIEVPVLSAYQSRFGSKIVFKIADKNHSGYPSNSVTLITEKIIQLPISCRSASITRCKWARSASRRTRKLCWRS